METTVAPLTPEQRKLLVSMGNQLPEPWTVERYTSELIQRGGFIPVRDYLLELYRKTAGPLVGGKSQPSAEIRTRVLRIIPKSQRRAEAQRELDPLQRWLLRHYPKDMPLTCAGCGQTLNIGDYYQVTSKDDLVHSTCEAA